VSSHDEGGQATVELALALPILLLLVMLLVQVALVVRDQVRVVHAAREAARAAAVHEEVAPVVDAALTSARLSADRTDVERGPRGRPGTMIEVVVRYRSPTRVPIVGALIDDVTVVATAAMRVEG
jgi:TadE-like protein